MRSHLLPHCSRFLPALRQRGEDYFVYFHSTLAHCVLLASGRNYSANFSSGATHRQVPSLHNDTGDTVHHCHCHCPQCSLPETVNTYNVTLGQEGFSQHTSTFAGYEETSHRSGIVTMEQIRLLFTIGMDNYVGILGRHRESRAGWIYIKLISAVSYISNVLFIETSPYFIQFLSFDHCIRNCFSNSLFAAQQQHGKLIFKFCEAQHRFWILP